MSFTNKHDPIVFDYLVNDTILERTDSATYLGILFDQKLSFGEHIEQIVKKANSAMYFIKRVFSKSSKEIKEKVYFALVRSKLEYAATAWDPFRLVQIDKLERVQRRAARFVMNEYDTTYSVSEMLNKLNWDSLSARRQFARLKNFYLVYNEIGGWVDLFEYLKPPGRVGRSNHPFFTRTVGPKSDCGKYSFMTRTANEWNNLPQNFFRNCNSFNNYKTQLRNHLFKNKYSPSDVDVSSVL
jgi:hypothetical protein